MAGSRVCFLLVLLLATAGGDLATHARAIEAAPRLTVEAASVGFGGKFKAGFWQPVRLALVAGSTGARGRLELLVPDGDQTPVIYANEATPALDLKPGERAKVVLYAKSGPISAPITLQLRVDEAIVWSERLVLPAALPATQELVVSVGNKLGVEEAVATIRRPTAIALQAAQLEGAEELPTVWWGYEGVDLLVVATSNADKLAKMSSEQRAALLEWVRLGGRIVLCVGSEGERIAADPMWSQLLPGVFSEVAPLQERSGLETFTKVELPVNDESYQRNRPRITRLKQVRGEVLVGEETSTVRPLVVRATAGLGEVYFVGLDLDHPALAKWSGRYRLLGAIFQRHDRQRDSGEREARRGISRLGYEDLSGQLRTALDQFPGVALVSITTVSVLVGAYLLLIGPGDFLLITRMGWPRQITWLTFSLIAVAFIGLASWLSASAHGGRVRINQVEIVDIDVKSQTVRGTVWAHLYSPRTRHFRPAMQIDAPEGTVEGTKGWLSWQGLPGDSIGGLGSNQVARLKTEPYRAGEPGGDRTLSGLPISIASSKSVSGRWWGKLPTTMKPELSVDQFGLLIGKFQQPLPVELTECILAHGEKLFRLGTLQPGQTVTIDPQASLNLEWRLTLRRVQESKDVSEPWNQFSTDVPRIVQMMMLHEAARGSGYTGLTHRYQPYVDFSEHVRLGQAVLIGRAAAPISQFRTGDEALAAAEDTQTWTWYRIVFPVQPQGAATP